MKRQKKSRATKRRKPIVRSRLIGQMPWRPGCEFLAQGDRVLIEQRPRLANHREADRVVLHRDQLPELITLLKKAAT